MKISSRRAFLKSAAITTAGSTCLGARQILCEDQQNDLDQIIASKLLRRELFKNPVIIESLELLRYRDNFICRIRSADGAEGLTVCNNMQMISLYPIFKERLQPFFLGKDARDLEALLDQVYVYKSNYKLQNLALWVPLATIEFTILDLLGRLAEVPMANLLGDMNHKEIAVYQANNYRGKSAEESISLIERDVTETQAKALKFKVGGRMSHNADYPPGRSEALIPLVRKTFGDEMTIYADSNGSYDLAESIRIGKMMEAHKFDFFEEPTPFDWYEETRQVASALHVPIAGGEQEPSMRQFRWLIDNNALDILQPDIFYFGGMIRSLKVALMAQARGKTCVPHISGSGLGFLYMLHFVSILPNAGPYHEFKGFNSSIPMQCDTSALESNDGKIEVPKGPGTGVEIDPDFIARHKIVT